MHAGRLPRQAGAAYPSAPSPCTHRLTPPFTFCFLPAASFSVTDNDFMTAPLVHGTARGFSWVAETVSISEYLMARMEDELFNGPLSDYEWSEGGEDEPSSKEEAAAAQPHGTS